MLFFRLLSFRLLCALLVQTYFSPDEYWQSLEVAHSMIFGYGCLTWEWREKIRGILHPLIFAALYKVLKVCSLDYPLVIVRLHIMGSCRYRFLLLCLTNLSAFFILIRYTLPGLFKLCSVL